MTPKLPLIMHSDTDQAKGRLLTAIMKELIPRLFEVRIQAAIGNQASPANRKSHG